MSASVVIFLLLLQGISITVDSQSIIKKLPGFSGDLPFKLETGYIGVGEEEEIQLFYYFVESERSPTNDPLMIWLAGGPGCSALRALFFEIGPLAFNYENSTGNKPTLELMTHRWTKVANIIYIDQPVGTGFSYATNSKAYKTSDTLSAAQTYEFLRKWIRNHPRFRNNPLYVSGISYIGMVLPILALDIYNGNEAGNDPPLNIKGYMLGNPLTDKNKDVNSRVDFAHRMGLLSDELYWSTDTNCDGNYIEIKPNNLLCANDIRSVNKCTEKINLVNILEPLCSIVAKRPDLLRWEGSSDEEIPRDFLWSLPLPRGQWCRGFDYLYANIWANDKTVQKALNIREGTIKEWTICNHSIEYSFGVNETKSYYFNVDSTFDYHRNLTSKNCRALIFSGDHDMRIPHLSTEKWIHFLNLTVENQWEPWFVEGQVAGFVLTCIIVRIMFHIDHSRVFKSLYKPKQDIPLDICFKLEPPNIVCEFVSLFPL